MGVCADLRAGAAESESDSTKSLTMKSLLLKVSRVKTCGIRADWRVVGRERAEDWWERRDAVSEVCAGMIV